MSCKTVLVTGASGFLGAHITRLIYFKWPAIREIRMFDCNEPRMDFITTASKLKNVSNGFVKAKVTYCRGNLLDMGSLMTSLDSVDVVIHCAAVIEVGSRSVRKRMFKVNVIGTQNVIKACLQQGVKVLVGTSSVFQYLSLNCRIKDADESIPLPEQTNTVFPDYGSSKAASEKLVLAANGSKGSDGTVLKTCALRCPGMYGELDNNFIPQAAQIARRLCGYYPFVGDPSCKMQVIYGGNAAWAHVTAAQALLDDTKASRVGGRAYFLGDYTPLHCNSGIIIPFLIEMKYKTTPFRVPMILVILLAYLMELIIIILSFFNIDLKSSLSLGSVRAIMVYYSFNWDKVREDVGYQPLFSNKEAMENSVSYYSQCGK